MFSIYPLLISRLRVFRFETALVITCFVMAAAVSIAGVFFIKMEVANARKAAQEQLCAVADLKARQIVNWREERLGDARFFSQARFVAHDIKQLLDNPDSQKAHREVWLWMELLKSGDRYQRVVLFDSSLKQRLSIPEPNNDPIDPFLKAILTAALHTNGVIQSDLHTGKTAQDISIDLVFPVFEADVPSGIEPPVIGLIQLQLDPHRFLYPLIRSRPTPSATAETVLVRQEGNEVLYLSDVNDRARTALSLRLPLNLPNLPVAAAVRGFTGVMEGRNSRGVPVVAVSRPIPGTRWFMVTQMNREELYAPLRKHGWMGGILFSALLVAGSLLIALLWRHRATAELKKANLELEKRVRERTADLNEKNSELESFTSTVSHDLKTPLRGIEGYSDLLLTDYAAKLDEDGRRYLQSIRQSAAQMNQLIEDLLGYSRLEWQSVSMDMVDPGLLARELLEEHKAEIQARKVKISVNISSKPFLTDVSGLTQALRNLIGNALKFSSDVSEPSLEIRGHDEGATCVLEVRDNGVGFDMKDKERIFEIFTRLPHATRYPGTGVGLAIVRKSIQRMGGRGWAESEPGKGAAFFIETPRR